MLYYYVSFGNLCILQNLSILCCKIDWHKEVCSIHIILIMSTKSVAGVPFYIPDIRNLCFLSFWITFAGVYPFYLSFKVSHYRFLKCYCTVLSRLLSLLNNISLTFSKSNNINIPQFLIVA